VRSLIESPPIAIDPDIISRIQQLDWKQLPLCDHQVFALATLQSSLVQIDLVCVFPLDAVKHFIADILSIVVLICCLVVNLLPCLDKLCILVGHFRV
jgi:hypothetical protein